MNSYVNLQIKSFHLPFSIFGVSGAICGRPLELPMELFCCVCPLGVDSFSAKRGFAAAIVNLMAVERISNIT